jgi:hypothetical protein
MRKSSRKYLQIWTKSPGTSNNPCNQHRTLAMAIGGMVPPTTATSARSRLHSSTMISSEHYITHNSINGW